jgi:hypothetical protein
MTATATTARASSVVFPMEPADLSVRPRFGAGQLHLWRRISFWPAELVRLVALIYMLPVVIYAIGIPVAAAIKAVLFCAGWVGKALWP